MRPAPPGGKNSMSPRPSRDSAPFASKMVRESTRVASKNDSLAGMFALITPVITLTLGR